MAGFRNPYALTQGLQARIREVHRAQDAQRAQVEGISRGASQLGQVMKNNELLAQARADKDAAQKLNMERLAHLDRVKAEQTEYDRGRDALADRRYGQEQIIDRFTKMRERNLQDAERSRQYEAGQAMLKASTPVRGPSTPLSLMGGTVNLPGAAKTLPPLPDAMPKMSPTEAMNLLRERRMARDSLVPAVPKRDPIADYKAKREFDHDLANRPGPAPVEDTKMSALAAEWGVPYSPGMSISDLTRLSAERRQNEPSPPGMDRTIYRQQKLAPIAAMQEELKALRDRQSNLFGTKNTEESTQLAQAIEAMKGRIAEAKAGLDPFLPGERAQPTAEPPKTTPFDDDLRVDGFLK